VRYGPLRAQREKRRQRRLIILPSRRCTGFEKQQFCVSSTLGTRRIVSSKRGKRLASGWPPRRFHEEIQLLGALHAVQHEQVICWEGNPEAPANPPPDVIPGPIREPPASDTEAGRNFTPCSKLSQAGRRGARSVRGLRQHAGSGSGLGRRFVGIELDEAHHRTASTRWRRNSISGIARAVSCSRSSWSLPAANSTGRIRRRRPRRRPFARRCANSEDGNSRAPKF